jgi:aminopeptidase N
MVKAGRHDVGLFLDLASDFSADTTPDVVEAVATRLAVVGEDLVSEAQQPLFRRWIQARFGPAFEELGFPGRRNDDDERQSRRAALLELLGVTGDAADVQKRARETALKYIADPASLSGTLAPTVLQVAAFGGDAALYDRYLSRMKAVASDPEEYYRFFNTLPYFRDPALIRRTLELSISDDVRTQDTATLIAGLLVRPWGREAAWSFVKTRWDTLTSRLGTFQGIPIIVGAVGSFCSLEAAADVRQFFAEHPVKTSERTLRQSIEKIEGCAAFHKRQAPALRQWLQASGSGHQA